MDLRKQVGGGYCGTVFKVVTDNNTTEAHKELGPCSDSWDIHNIMLANEAKIYQDLQKNSSDKGYERIVRFIGVEDDNERDLEGGGKALRLRMEFVERDLYEMTERITDPKWDDLKIRIIYEIAEGLDFIHRKGYIHADIWAGNILLTRDMHVKICDFGLTLQKGDEDRMRYKGGDDDEDIPPATLEYSPEYSQGKDIEDLTLIILRLWKPGTSAMPQVVRMYVHESVKDMGKQDSAARLMGRLRGHLEPPSMKNRIEKLVKELQDILCTESLSETSPTA